MPRGEGGAAGGEARPPPAHALASPGYQVAVLVPSATTAGGQAGLAALAAEPARALVASDYDGTLAQIVDDPANAVPVPGAVAALTRLATRVGTVAIITGRPAADAVSLGGLGDVPGLIVLGHYGAGEVVMRAAVAGTGIIAGGPVRAVCEALGIEDVVAKSVGTSNPHNMVKAAFAALTNCTSPRSVAARRSKKVSEITS